MTKIFVTGATGYVGGDALYAIVQAHPEYEMTALVRNSDKGVKVAQQYAKVKLVYGDLDSNELIAQESSKADIVFNFASSDHLPALTSIIRGLASTHSASHLGYLIHTSGIASLFPASTFTYPSTRGTLPADYHEFNDWPTLDAILALPDTAWHHATDHASLDASATTAGAVRTATVSPAGIYGAGRGPDNARSMVLPALARATLQQRAGVVVSAGANVHSAVHVSDVSALFVALGEAAVAGGGKAGWDRQGYYFCEGTQLTGRRLGEIASETAARVGLLEKAEVRSVSAEEADGMIPPMGSIMLGASARGVAVRARELLGWRPTGKSVEEEMESALWVEAKALGLWKTHDQTVEED